MVIANHKVQGGWAMPVHIFIQGEKFSNTQNIVQWITSRTGWPVVTDDDLIQRAGERSGMRPEQIEHALYRRNPVMRRKIRHREQAKAFLKTSLAETLRSEAGILWGMAGHLIPKNMPHILRVFVTAASANRIQRASQDRDIPEKEARYQIKKTDHRLSQWQYHLFGGGSFDAAHFDVVVPTEVLDTEAAARFILEHLTEKANAASDDVDKALEDFALAAEVQLVLAEKGYDITASAENGRVMLTVDSKVFRLNKMAEKLKHLIGEMPDVAGVEIKVGRNYYRTDIYRRCRFEMSPGLKFKSYAKQRRHLRQSAISNLPNDIIKRPLPTQIGLGRSLSL
jgi:two-component system response regulator CpxR